MAEKIIRDPVHDVIAFRTDDPIDALLFSLINAREFQRLHRIRQLGLAHLAYPGADHSRYSHSLGVMETARRMLAHLSASFTIDKTDQAVCLAAALLHDLGHGPFSHAFEGVTGIHHETLTRQLILNPATDVHAILRRHDATFPDRVAGLIAGRQPRTFLDDILASQLDADRLDYLLRDNLNTGSRYGDYDLTWLIHALTLGQTGPNAPLRLVVTSKGVSAVEAYLQARYHMYRNVYFHKVVCSGEAMLRLIFDRARLLFADQRLGTPAADDPIAKALTGQTLSAEEFTELDDVSVTGCFKNWAHGSDPILARLCHGLLYRRVYKTIDLSRIDDLAVIGKARATAAAAVKRSGGDAVYDLVYDEPADQPQKSPEEEILIQQPAGSLVPFASASPMSAALGGVLTFRRLHVAEPYRDAVRAALRDVAGAGIK
jgi:uncharacterized protein